MKILLLLFYLFIIPFSAALAQNEAISIEAKIQGKRTLLYAQNHTDSIVNFFLKVNATGYRRSADKPLITNIDPGTKMLVMTLIAIDPNTAHYDYDLIINATLDNSINLDREKFYVEDIGEYLDGNVVLFSTADCEKCTLLDSLLTVKRVPFRHFDLNQDQKLYNQFVVYLANTKGVTVNDSIPLPVIWNKLDWLSSEPSAKELAALLQIN